MHERSALRSREYDLIQFFRKFFPAHDQPAARPAQGLVRCRCDKVHMGERVGVQASGYHPCNVSNVCHRQRSNRAGNLMDALEIDDSGIGAGAAHDETRFVFPGQPRHLIVIDPLVALPDPVGNDPVHLSREIERMAVRQMSPVSQAHAQ